MSLLHPILFPFICLLLGAFLQLISGRVLSNRGRGWLAFVSTLGAFGGVLTACPVVDGGGALELHLMPWDGPFSLVYHVDGLSILFALMATFIGSAVLLYSIEYMEKESGTPRFYALVLVFIAGLVHLVYSADLIAMYLSWEVIGLCSFLLVGFWYQKKEAVAGARKVIVMTHLAGYGLLAGILILFSRTGSTLWTDPAMKDALSSDVFLLILLAAAAKSVQFPLHTWIPDAMAAPTPVSALLHAACYVKAGVYLVARLHSLAPWPPAWSAVVVWMGVITLTMGALFAVVQTDLKRLLAYSTVSQIGYMMLGIGLGSPLGIAAGLLHCLNHGLFKAGLFLGAGAVQHAAGTRDMSLLGGLAKKMPRTTIFWLINGASIAGIPFMSGFVSKWLLYNAGLEAGQYAAVLIAWLVSIVTVFYFLKATSIVFFGEPTTAAEKAHEVGGNMGWGMGILAAGSVVLGLAPQIAMLTIINPVLRSLRLAPIQNISWLGIGLTSGSWWTSGGLLLAALAGGVGVLIYFLAGSARQTSIGKPLGAGAGVFTGGEPLSGSGRLPVGDFSAILTQGLAPFYRVFDADRYYLKIWSLLHGLAEMAETLSQILEERALLILPIILVVLLGIGVAALPALPAAGRAAQNPFSIVWAAVLALAYLGLATATWFSQKARPVFRSALASGLLVLAGLLQGDALLRLICLEAAALIVVWVVWKTSANRKTGPLYLAVVLLSAVCLFAGQFLLAAGQTHFGAACYFAGFALKLALIPAYLWLSSTAENTPALVVGWITAVVDMAAFVELWELRQAHAEIFASPTPWLALAVLSALGGALLMLGQGDLKRFLAFSSIEDMGYLIGGVVLAGQWGLAGALAGGLTHILAKTLLFGSLCAPENKGPLTLERRGQALAFPLSGVAFLIGTLAMLGVPALPGFSGRWRLYLAAYQVNPILMGVFLLASGLALLAYIRVLTAFWWFGEEDNPKRQSQPIGLNIILAALTLILLAVGVIPGLVPALTSLLGGLS